MYQTINVSQFRDAFKDKGRSTQFSYDGLSILYDYLEENFDGKYELDVIELCCEFTEDTIEEALSNYNLDSLDELRDNTLVLEVNDNTIIYQNY